MTSHPWELPEAVKIVSELNPLVRGLNYHVALGGSVVNQGWSDKDIDIYVLPVFKGERHDHLAVMQAIHNYFHQVYGGVDSVPLFGSSSGVTEEGSKVYAHQSKLTLWKSGRRRIDLFVARGNE